MNVFFKLTHLPLHTHTPTGEQVTVSVLVWGVFSLSQFPSVFSSLHALARQTQGRTDYTGEEREGGGREGERGREKEGGRGRKRGGGRIVVIRKAVPDSH